MWFSLTTYVHGGKALKAKSWKYIDEYNILVCWYVVLYTYMFYLY